MFAAAAERRRDQSDAVAANPANAVDALDRLVCAELARSDRDRHLAAWRASAPKLSDRDDPQDARTLRPVRLAPKRPLRNCELAALSLGQLHVLGGRRSTPPSPLKAAAFAAAESARELAILGAAGAVASVIWTGVLIAGLP